MNKIGRFFTHPVVISLIGLLLVALLIWFAGPHIKFGADNQAPLADPVTRLLLIMAAIILWGLNNLRLQMMTNRNNKTLVTELQSNNSYVQADVASEQAADEIAQINDRFRQALDTLNKLKFAGKGKKKALYQLPWYIIVGPPGSGKTTALVNSGLEFPLADQFGKGALQGVGGTRNCDWWFTNEAVLIDTAGRYTTQDSHKVVDSSAWEGFLALLKRNRRRRPVNGVIVAISLQDLLLQTEEERLMHAKTIRTRLDELMEKLEIRFPVYLLFTKSDLVSGFSEFFEDLGKEEREQVWGISLPNAPKPSQSPDFDFLGQELRNLSRRLHDRVIGRMQQERDVRRCAAIESFPLQMENLYQIAESFVKRTFAQNRFQFQPYLRGVYFSSGTQDGTPIDRLMTSVSANFGFAREATQAANQRGKSFFIARLFREVIFPESELVGTNMRYERAILWSQNAAYAGIAAVTLSIVLLWSGSVTRNSLYMSEVKEQIASFKAEEKKTSGWNTDASAALPALNALASASSVYDKESHPWLSGMGLYDDRVDREADRLYQQKLKTLFLPQLLRTLERVIQQGDPEGDLYQTFRIYIMFNALEHMNKSLVKSWFENQWDKHYGDNSVQRTELQNHLDALLLNDIPPSTLNASVVTQTRATLLRIPVAQRIYSRIKADPQFNQTVNVLNFYGESVRSTFKMDSANQLAFTIPVLFTIQGYQNLDLSPDSTLFADVADEEWVLGGTDNQALINRDVKAISEQVKNFYLADYSNTWLTIHNALHVSSFGNLRDLNTALSTFVDPVYSPLISILDVAKTNTQLTPPLLDAAADKINTGIAGQAVNYLADKVEGTIVDKRFSDLHALIQQSSRGPAPITSTMQQLEALKIFVQEIALSPDSEKKSFEIAKARYESGAANPVTALRTFARSTPEPVQGWLTTVSDEAWQVIMRSAHQYVNKEWRARVYQTYSQGLAGRYPLNRNASDELALLDFSGFFKPQGTVDQFVKEFVDPFIDRRSNWANKTVDGYAIGFSSATLNQLQRATNIRDVFFRQNPETPSISLELRPFTMNKDDALFTLDLGDQRLTYNHGPKFWKPVTWSGQNDSRRIRVIFEDLNGAQFDKSYTGPWAWFRLMDASNIQSTPQSNIYLITFAQDIDTTASTRKIVYEGRATSIHNPFKNDLLESFRCPESI
ncbi:type VI secretion protein [Cellvibrio mixtus]|uniref:Type VI secretion protein n=1 Tax=Cellvibrio mixtus TaxID=39650 RepID=A0A266QCH8_9GAMM|nr:type VI secretion system membrane subunit TssM [Cellvibrio mixtus]OZY87500.1 type VI secretion protein [Cellvibrio mixtus]